MSKIDQRIVEMKFDNAAFRRGISQTMSDLADLSKGLAMRGASSGLDAAQAAASRFSLGGMMGALQQAMGGFSALGVVAATTFATITQKALSAGTQLVKSFTMDPVLQGFQEYELKMGSIQTIMANTARHGTSLETVNAELEALNEYSDKTIYNFAEMTKNASLFTNSGMKIEDATTVIKGFSNAAAASGTSAEGAAGAAYQLSQALSAGTIRLMDWRSLSNVGMGGKNMQEGVIELAKAMGTFAGTGIDANVAAKDFNGSLEKGWLSADVMSTYLKAMSGDMTDAEYAATGLSAAQIEAMKAQAAMGLDAATKVRTFSQLMNTLKESVASGWSQSIELIFGNFTEATELFTGINDAIGGLLGKSSDARNKMLAEWKELGGRTALIDGIKLAFQALSNVIGPVAKAFRDVFPARTGQDLLNITVAFREFMRGLIAGEGTMENIRRTFQGIFSVVKIVTTILGGVTKAIFGLFDATGSSVGGFLAITAVIGDFLTAISQILTKTGAIQAFFSVLVSPLLILKPLVGLISDIAIAFGDLFSGDVDGFTSKVANAFGIFGDGLDAVSDRIDSFTNKLSKGLSTLADFVTNFAQKAADSGNTVIAGLAGALSSVLGFLSNFFSDARGTMSDLIQVLNGASVSSSNFLAGFSGGVLQGIMDLIDRAREKFTAFRDSLDFSGAFASFNSNASSAASTGGSILGGLGNMLSQVWGGLAGMFSGIGNALGPVTSSLGSFFSTLVTKITEYVKNLNMQDAVALLNTGIFIAMYLAIRGFFKKMSGLVDQLGGMIDSLTGIFDAVTNSLKAMQRNVYANIILKIAIAVGILAAAILVLSKIDSDDLKKALAALSILFVQLGIALAVITKIDPKSMMSSAGGLILLAVAIRIIVASVKALGEMEFEVLRQGLIALGLILSAIMVLVAVVSKNVGGMISAATGLLILSAALAALAAVILIYQKFDYATIIDGVGAMALTLALLGIAMNTMPKGMVTKAAGLVILAAALTILAGVLLIFSKFSVSEMAKSLIMLAASLAIMVAAVNLASGGLAGAAALLLIAVALNTLVPILTLFANLSWEGIAKGVVGLALVLGVLVVAMYALTPVIAVLAIFANALKTVGIAILLAGTGMALMAGAIGLLAVTGAAGFAVLVAGIMGFLQVLPLIAQQVGHAFVAFFAVMAAAAPRIMQHVGTMIMAFINKVAELAPAIFAAGLDMIMGFLRAIRDRIGTIVNIVADIIENFLSALSDRIGPIIEAGVDFILSFVEGLAKAIRGEKDRTGEAGADLAMAIIEGMIAGLEALWDLVPDKLKALGKAAVDAIKGFLGINSPSKVFDGIGRDTVMGMINGIGSLISNLGSKALELGKKAISSAKEGISNAASAGSEFVGKVVSGIGGALSSLTGKAKSIMGEAITAAKGALSKAGEIGGALVDGIASGIRNAASRVKEAAVSLANKLPGWVRSVLRIESPSKVFAEIGKQTVQGLAVGIDRNNGIVQDSTESLANNTINTLQKSLGNLGDLLTGEMDSQPVIRPILDLTDVQRNAARLAGMIPSQSIAASVAYSRAQSAAVGYATNRSAAAAVETPVVKEEINQHFVQHLHSPKSLSAADVYRNTRNQISVAKGALANARSG